ncbi:MAG: iron complex outermembrane receptor protein, partial [Gammaproteobacteria bacterium]
MSKSDIKTNTYFTPRRKALASAISIALMGGSGFSGAVLAQTGQVEAINEIIVTARKRTENLQDIPQSLQAFSGEDIRKYGIQGVSDLARFIPSLTYLESSPGQTKVVFRGVADADTVGIASPSTAVYLDEQSMTQGSQAPAIRPVDLERIEALQGPQGSLYGASSQSGTLRYITNKPNTEKFEANIGVGLGSIDGGEESYDVDAMVNIPINDQLAIRLVGFHAKDGGYIDNVLGTTPETGLRDNSNIASKDINDVEHTGGRVGIRWHVSENWTDTLMINYQKIEAGGYNDFDPTVGDLQTVKFFNESRDDEYLSISNVIEGDLGFADLMLATSYYDRDIAYVHDTTTYASYFDIAFGTYYATYDFGQDPIGFRRYSQNDERFSIEGRLSKDAENWKGVIGFFYEEGDQNWDFKTFTDGYRSSPAFAAWSGYYPSQAGNFGDAWWNSFEAISTRDYSFFGEVTFSFTENFDITFGGRYYDSKTTRAYAVERPDNRLDQAPVSPSGIDDGFLPKFGISYRFDENKMIYALHSQGFRTGGANRGRSRDLSPAEIASGIFGTATQSSPSFPLIYDGDTLKNWEAGFKTQWMDNRLRVNLSFYHMIWQDYQLEVIDPSFGPTPNALNFPFQIVVGNVADAVINGIDFDVTAVPTSGLELNVNGTWLIDHELDEDAGLSDSRITAQGGTPALDLAKGT